MVAVPSPEVTLAEIEAVPPTERVWVFGVVVTEQVSGVVAERFDPADFVDIIFSKSKVAVGAGGDICWVTASSWNGVFGEYTAWGNPADLVVNCLCEPEVAVGAGASRGDLTDLVP